VISQHGRRRATRSPPRLLTRTVSYAARRKDSGRNVTTAPTQLYSRPVTLRLPSVSQTAGLCWLVIGWRLSWNGFSLTELSLCPDPVETCESNLLRPVVKRQRSLPFLPCKNAIFIGLLLWHIHCGGIGVYLRRLHEMSRPADKESKDTVGGRGDVLTFKPHNSA
jgi:hypothetical protein